MLCLVEHTIENKIKDLEFFFKLKMLKETALLWELCLQEGWRDVFLSRELGTTTSLFYTHHNCWPSSYVRLA